MTTRIAPAQAPFAPEIQASLDAIMRGKPPLVLFTTLARDPRLFQKFFASSLLDRGNLTPRQREIVIDRTTALCRSEYEWGVHIATFAAHVGLTDAQINSLATDGPTENCDPHAPPQRGSLPPEGANFSWDGPAKNCWTEEERLLLALCNQLHAHATVDDALWQGLAGTFTDEAILELLMLAGFYRTVSYLTNALRLPLEPGAARFAHTGV